MEDLKSRIQMMLEFNIVEEKEYQELLKMIEVLQDEVSFSINDENTGVLITHVAAAMKRQREQDGVNPLDESIMEEMKQNQHYKAAEKIVRKLVNASEHQFPTQELEFIELHLCNLLNKEKEVA